MGSSTSKNEFGGMLPTAVPPKLLWLIFIIAGGSAFLVYWLTLAPDLTWANFGVDGGELITASVTLGVPHPPGYPTYVLLGKLFSLLPVGSIAYRFNLFSAVAVAAAVGFVSVISIQYSVTSNEYRSLNTEYWALITGLAFAYAPLVWSQAIITEVYGLNLAFLAAFVWALAGKRPSWLAGGLLGLSVTTHATSLFMLPLALAMTPRSDWGRLGGGVLLGLTPLLTLPWLAQTDSPVIWGDPTSLSGWRWLISGQLYHSNLFSFSSSEWPARLPEWGWELLGQFTWAGWPLIAFSFYRTRGPVLRWRSGLLGTAVLYLIYALGYDSRDAIVFTLPALLLLSLLLAPGLRRLGGAALLLPLASLLLNYGALDLSGDTIRPMADRLLNAAPANAVLLTPGDQTIFTMWYFQHVEEQRPGLILVDANLFAFDWYRERLQQQYPGLRGLEVDDLDGFRRVNGEIRPFCFATLQPGTLAEQLTCFNDE